MKFEGTVPAQHDGNFGFQIHGNNHNDFISDMQPDVWKFVSYVGLAPGGMDPQILFIFDSMGGNQKVYISQPSIELFDEEPEPLLKPKCNNCAS